MQENLTILADEILTSACRGRCFKNLIRLLFVQNGLSIARRWRKPKPAKANYRGVPTHACPCGEKVFIIRATFDDYEISLYQLDAECSACGALLTAPCLADADA